MDRWDAPSPRCGEPMRSRSDNEPEPRCERPAGHTPNRHLSRTAYRNGLRTMRERRRRWPRYENREAP